MEPNMAFLPPALPRGALCLVASGAAAVSSQPGVGHLDLKYWLPRLLAAWLGPVE